MTRHVALLRAVNLGPRNKVSMTALRDVAGTLGLTHARTLLQSGNLLFDDPRNRTAGRLEKLLEDAVAAHCQVRTEIFVRDAMEWSAIIAANPFPTEARNDPGHLVVACGREEIPAERIDALQRAIIGRERVRAVGRELFVYYPDGIGRSKLTAAFMSKHLGANGGTGRNWNTVQRIMAALQERD